MSGPATASQGCFVEASAGTGKTTALVNAIAEAIAAGVQVERIVAVTFTHQAAGEMKLRVRSKLEELRTDATARALQSLDRAFIGTIHSFCAMLLRLRPVEACVDPDFEELDEVQARRVFDGVFRGWIERRLAAPSDVLSRALARQAWRENRDAPLDSLGRAAWNLAEWRDYDAPWEKRDIDRAGQTESLLARARATVALWPAYEQARARIVLSELVHRIDRAREAGAFHLNDAESELLSIPARLQWLKFQRGSQIAAAWKELLEAATHYRRQSDADLASRLRDELWDVVAEYQRAKRSAGQVDFTDLLLYARDLMRHPGARPELQARYDRVFVDEFQDTDPLQAEILTTLAGPEKLFVVGDPKQSIYRFRRAEPRVYADTRDHLRASGAAEQQLSRSYRSTDAIQSFVNAAFGPMMETYLPLTGGPPAPLDQPSVVALPMPHPYKGNYINGKAILSCSPATVAGFIEWLLHRSGWTVRDGNTRRKMVDKDICILFRRFVNNGVDLTQDYVRSLESRRLEHVLVGSKGLHEREETGVIRAALQAVEWRDDELSEYATLNGPLFGIDAGTLFRFREQRGVSEELDFEFEPVRQAREILDELHEKRNHRPIADTIRRLLEAVRGHASFAFHKGGPRRLANLHRLAELARQADAGGALTFRGFVEWLLHEAEAGEAAEAPVLEQQPRGVRLMTVHKAKGLEFPVVILADLSAGLTNRFGSGRYVDPAKRLCAQRLLFCAPWELAEHEDDEERAERDEAARVAYVAATRAKDLLVVSAVGDGGYPDGWLSPLYDALYPPKDRRGRPSRAPGCPDFGQQTVLSGPSDGAQIRPGSHRPAAGSHEVVWFDPAVLRLSDPPSQGAEREHLLEGTPEQIATGLSNYNAWREQRADAIRAGSRPRVEVRSATEIGTVAEAAGIPVEVLSVEALPQRPAGRRFGRLLHAVLQSGGGAAQHGRRLDATSEEIAAATEVSARVLAHPALSAEGRTIYRELPVTVRLDDGTVVEGRIDFASTDGDSWTVVDYKSGIDDRAKGTRQLQLYALALHRATRRPVRAVLLEI